ncbi:hypothetical protein LCGC14_0606860 [marine sediment metagenome]|uniref:Uncharacterized protein n=1 Tax=marine sediment metagenome TaxID=412755 RepID=A0A0F9RSZ8_9ZZZZ
MEKEQIEYVKTLVEDSGYKIPVFTKDRINDILLQAKDIKSTKLVLDKIKITPEENSLLKPETLDFIHEDGNMITFVKGESSTGKTSIFDKISHFFLIPKKRKSIIKNEQTTLHLYFSRSNGSLIYITFGSIKTNKFEIRLKKNKDVLEYSKVENSEKFLSNNNIFRELNCMHFIREISGDSFFKKYFSTKSDLKPLFRSTWLNEILDEIRIYEKDLAESLKKANNLKEGQDDTLNSIENDKKNKQNHSTFLKFLVDSEKILVELYDRVEERKNEAHIDKEKHEELRKLKKKRNKLRKELQILEDFKNKNLKSKMDVYIDQNLFKCNICENYLSHNTLKKRIKEKYCWNCGKFEKNYDLAIDSLEVPEFDSIIKEIDNLKAQLRQSKIIIQEIEATIPKIEEIIKEYDKKIVKELTYYSEKSELLDEIEAAKGNINKIGDELRGISRIEERIKRQKGPCIKEISDIQESIKKIEEFKISITSINDKSIDKIISEILKYANQFLINIFQRDDIGKIYFHPENKKLALSITYEDDESEIKKKIHWCYETTTSLAQGYNRKIDLALAFALLKANRTNNLTSFSNFFLIDGLETFNSQELTRFLNDLGSLKDIRFFIFVNEIPKDLKQELYNVKELSRNKRITKDESLDLSTQKKMFEFMS